MASNPYSVEIIVSATDQASQHLDKIGDKLDQFKKKTEGGGGMEGMAKTGLKVLTIAEAIRIAGSGIALGVNVWKREQAIVKGDYGDILKAQLKITDSVGDLIRSIPMAGRGLAHLFEALSGKDEIESQIKLVERLNQDIDVSMEKIISYKRDSLELDKKIADIRDREAKLIATQEGGGDVFAREFPSENPYELGRVAGTRLAMEAEAAAAKEKLKQATEAYYHKEFLESEKLRKGKEEAGRKERQEVIASYEKRRKLEQEIYDENLKKKSEEIQYKREQENQLKRLQIESIKDRAVRERAEIMETYRIKIDQAMKEGRGLDVIDILKKQREQALANIEPDKITKAKTEVEQHLAAREGRYLTMNPGSKVDKVEQNTAVANRLLSHMIRILENRDRRNPQQKVEIKESSMK